MDLARFDAAATAVRDFAQFRDSVVDSSSKLRTEVLGLRKGLEEQIDALTRLSTVTEAIRGAVRTKAEKYVVWADGVLVCESSCWRQRLRWRWQFVHGASCARVYTCVWMVKCLHAREGAFAPCSGREEWGVVPACFVQINDRPPG